MHVSFGHIGYTGTEIHSFRITFQCSNTSFLKRDILRGFRLVIVVYLQIYGYTTIRSESIKLRYFP